MTVSWIWMCPASMLMLLAMLLLVIRMPLRKKALATYVSVALVGVIIPLAALAFDAYPVGEDATASAILMILLCAVVFGPIAAWTNYSRYKYARELLRRGYVEALPKWMQNIYRYLYDVDD